jgi:hypothetical protein
VDFDNFSANGEPHPCPLVRAVAGMKTLERQEQAIEILLVEADSIIL